MPVFCIIGCESKRRMFPEKSLPQTSNSGQNALLAKGREGIAEGRGGHGWRREGGQGNEMNQINVLANLATTDISLAAK